MTKNLFDRYFLDGWRPYAWIACAAFLLYFKSLFFGYTFLDDNALILNNIDFLKNIGNVGAAFAQKVFAKSYLPYYRPVLTISFMFDAQVGGSALLFYHLMNIAYHALASCLVLVLLTRLGYGRLQSFLCAMVFVVHPVLSQGVAWIPGRNDTLLAVFILLSFISFLGVLRTGRAGYYVAHLAFLLLAIFTKETALVLFVMCILYLHLIKKEKPFSYNEITFAGGWFACLCIWYSFRHIAVQSSLELTVFEMFRLLGSYLPAAVQFIGKIFFPFNLSVFPVIQDTAFFYGIAAIIFLAAAIACTRSKRYGFIAFGLAWAIFFILPSLIRANYRISADFIEHRVYVPMIGFFILLLETDIMKRSKRPVQIAAAAAVICVYAALTFFHIDNFKDRLTFWDNAVKTSPRSPFAHLAMGQAYDAYGRIDDAEAEYRKSVLLDPLEPGPYFGLGEICFKKGKLQEAEVFFKKTIAAYPYFDNGYLELGALYYKQGRMKEAEWAWNKAIAINPDNVLTNKFLAIFYFEQKDYEKSARYARQLQALGLQPPPEFLKSLGIE